MKPNPEPKSPGEPIPPEFQDLERTLHAWRDVPAPDLAGRVLAATRLPAWRTPAAIAAGLLLLVGATWWTLQAHRSPSGQASLFPVEPEAAREWIAAEPAPTPVVASVSPAPSATDPLIQAREWLVQVQDEQGGWTMGRSGAAANYTVGLSALALLAVSSPSPSASPEVSGTLDRGLVYLKSQQDPASGLFGPDITGSLYNHTLACLALLELEPARSPELEKGLHLLAQTQHKDGGWSYLRARQAPPNSSLTVWALLVLLEAEARGIPGYSGVVQRGLAWIQATVDTEGRAGYRRPGDHPHGSETLTAAVALCLATRDHVPVALRQAMLDRVLADAGMEPATMDFYRTYFQAAALREAGLGQSPALAELKARLASAQEEAGSWASDDPWARTGGRVYSTALAMLTLQGK